VPDGTSEPAEGDAVPVTLSEPERRLLRILVEAAGPQTEDALGGSSGLAADSLRGTLQRLRSKRLAVVEETHDEVLRLTTRGERTRARGLPERRLLALLAQRPGGVDPGGPELREFEDEERSAAVGILRRRGYLAAGTPFRLSDTAAGLPPNLPEESTVEAIVRGDSAGVDRSVVPGLLKRGLVAIERLTNRTWSASEEGQRMPLGEATSQLGALTPALLRQGSWRDATFRPYDVRADVPFVTGARPHPYVAWLEEFEELLVGLGFEQAEGPLLETEFWNADVLFMPQEHPARSIHDVLTVQGLTGRLPDPALLERVAAVHEGRALPGEAQPITPGWRATYDPEIARRPVLRSQTTAVSARFLAAHPTPPFRMYSIDRNFRRESLDATHHVEFGQCEGVLGQEGTTLKHLIGVFRSLAEGIGIRSLRIRPSYFPFTEPSIEGYVKHPRLGWIEIFPGGMFRPEVLRPLGITTPVAAWGIGVTRLAMVGLGVSDIRDLYLDDLSRLRSGRG
jgi:phenylalanyl-tRNA synthetase alpha chain